MIKPSGLRQLISRENLEGLNRIINSDQTETSE
jgi:hypothetical protein